MVARRKFTILIAFLTAVLPASGCRRETAEPGLQAIDPPTLDAHLRFLSADILLGRAPGTPGGEFAAAYIANQMEVSGLRPAVGDTSYLQPVPLLAQSQEIQVSFRALGGAALSPRFGSEFVGWSGDTAQQVEQSGELVFVGYGISAPELDWDDYADVDVSGSFLLVLPGEPERGGSLAAFAHWSHKLEEAERRGAAGVILVHTRELAGFGWDVVRALNATPRLALAGGPPLRRLVLEAWLSQEAVEQLVEMAGLDLATLLELSQSGESRPVATGVTVSLAVRSANRRLIAANVAGFLPGSDPELARQVVLFIAHYDHLGVAAAADDDSIYNGAYDNAAGTALLLGLAEAFARLAEPPRRSLLFLAVTAGESGPLGSTLYIREPLLPLSHTVAVINLDGGNLWGPTRDVVVHDAESSTLNDVVAAAARAEGLEPAARQVAGENARHPSDHQSFLRVGIPAVRVGHGLDFLGRMPDWGRQRLEEYFARHYRRPSDEYPADLDLRGAVQQGRVAFRIGLLVANAEERPVWSEAGEPANEVRNGSGVTP